MPIYEYRCPTCNTTFEEWTKSFDSPSSEPCPKCGHEAVRIISNTSFMLKGGGWYVTDYAGHKSHGAESTSEAASEKASTSDTAPAATTDSKPAASTSETPAPATTTPESKPTPAPESKPAVSASA